MRWSLTIMVVAVLTGCKTTQYVPVVEHRTDTMYQSIVQHDSIVQKDSIHIKEQGDTVRIERWHTKYIERHMHDTIREVSHDTVPHPYPVEVIKKEEKPLTLWQQTRMHIGGITLWAAVFALFGWALKKRLKI